MKIRSKLLCDNRYIIKQRRDPPRVNLNSAVGVNTWAGNFDFIFETEDQAEAFYDALLEVKDIPLHFWGREP